MDDLSRHVSSVFPDPHVSNLALNSASLRASDGQSGPEKMEAEAVTFTSALRTRQKVSEKAPNLN